MAVTTWHDLAELRRNGLRPELPVYVTDRRMLTRNMTDVGCIAILHKRGDAMPVRWLMGLDVRLDFDRCDLAAKVSALMRDREVRPRSLRAWCRCAGDFVALCGDCDKGGEPWCG